MFELGVPLVLFRGGSKREKSEFRKKRKKRLFGGGGSGGRFRGWLAVRRGRGKENDGAMSVTDESFLVDECFGDFARPGGDGICAKESDFFWFRGCFEFWAGEKVLDVFGSKNGVGG